MHFKTSVIKKIFADQHKYEIFFYKMSQARFFTKKKFFFFNNNLAIHAVIIHITIGLIILI